MAKIETIKADEMGILMGLLVHDLRNPAATISANVDFLQEVGLSDPDSTEALQDVKLAVGELRRGLDLLAWISRWMSGQAPVEAVKGDAGVFVKRLERAETPVPVTVEVNEQQELTARGAQVAVEIIHILLYNTRANIPGGSAHIRVFNSEDRVVIELRDEGEALAPELRESAFTLPGQKALKGRSDGRYSRFAGLFAASIALQGVGGTIEAGGNKGAATFTIRLRTAPQTRPPAP